MSRMNKEIYLLLRDTSVLLYHLIPVKRKGCSGNKNYIKQYSPWSKPQRTLYDNTYTSFFQQLIIIKKYGSDSEFIFSRRKVCIFYHTIFARGTPFVEESFQLPCIIYVRRIIIVYRRYINRECILVIFQF